ncbi:hypothetical protein QAD02_020842 [Eretmocerus hayati]|uniref:Uncharacterized protein n=1 Tax=Eretmocerus hayati TaxID=131215 RepID=A0ACC2PP19_9HYME|nr:hypothetical protein QAD02_020842 [Eretmocerus hayati]
MSSSGNEESLKTYNSDLIAKKRPYSNYYECAQKQDGYTSEGYSQWEGRVGFASSPKRKKKDNISANCYSKEGGASENPCIIQKRRMTRKHEEEPELNYLPSVSSNDGNIMGSISQFLGREQKEMDDMSVSIQNVSSTGNSSGPPKDVATGSDEELMSGPE